MTIWETRYQAEKVRNGNTYYKVVKVSGGHAVMTADEYRTWKKQK